MTEKKGCWNTCRHYVENPAFNRFSREYAWCKKLKKWITCKEIYWMDVCDDRDDVDLREKRDMFLKGCDFDE